MKYKNGAAFRRALEDRLRSRSLQTGVPLVRLRKMVAFDRLLARLIQHHSDIWVLKGGLALQLRIGERARTTKDIDMLFLNRQQDFLQTIRNVGNLDLGDWFIFDVAESTMHMPNDNDEIRYNLQARLDDREFESFHIDVGFDDPIVEPVDYLRTPALLDFADIKPTIVPCYPLTQQIAEKMHAYTRLHPSGESSRVKDLVDMLLMGEMGEIDGEKLHNALFATFEARQTHTLPKEWPEPPAGWSASFRKIASEVRLGYSTLDDANEAIKRFLNPVLSGETIGTWNPINWSWQ